MDECIDVGEMGLYLDDKSLLKLEHKNLTEEPAFLFHLVEVTAY